MASTEDLEEGEVTAVLDLAILVAVIKLNILDAGLVEVLLSWPLKSLSPGLVTEPVADEIGVTSIDQDRDLLKDAWYKTVEWLHPITLEEKVSVDIEVAAVIAADFNAQLFLNISLVQELADPAKSRVAKVVGVLALTTDIINVLAGSLVWTDQSVVAVDAGRNARPNALAVVASLNHALATGKCVLHSLAFALIENSWISTLSASHGLIFLILSQPISETVANENGLQVDVALLVGENLRGEDRDVVTGIRLSSNVEVLLGVLWELFEEEGKKGVDVLSGSNGVADGATAIGVTDIDWLVKEDNRGIGVPGVWVAVKLEVLINGGWTKFEEQSGEG